MENVNKTIALWLKELDQFKFQEYENFPDIDLYMDQVVTYLERQLNIFATSSLDKQITSSMINNYVKGNVIPAPIQKRYNREHLSLIEEVCVLKQVLSIAEVKELIERRYLNNTHSDIFKSFNDLHAKKTNEAVKFTEDILKDIKPNDVESLMNLSLDLALTANSFITIAKRILFYTSKYIEFNENSKEDEKKKDDLVKEEKKKKAKDDLSVEELEKLVLGKK